MRSALGGGRAEMAARLRHIMVRLDNQRSRLESQRSRLESQRERLTKMDVRLRRELGRQDKRLIKQQQAIGDVRATVDRVDQRGQEVDQRDKIRELDFRRAMQQLASVEVRLGTLEEKFASETHSADDASTAEARTLIEDIRREHDQVRARFQVISSYEERMRRLEAAVSQLYDGDMRNSL